MQNQRYFILSAETKTFPSLSLSSTSTFPTAIPAAPSRRVYIYIHTHGGIESQTRVKARGLPRFWPAERIRRRGEKSRATAAAVARACRCCWSTESLIPFVRAKPLTGCNPIYLLAFAPARAHPVAACCCCCIYTLVYLPRDFAQTCVCGGQASMFMRFFLF